MNLLVVSMVSLVLASATASADPTDEAPIKPQAKERFDRGAAHYNLGEYDEAIADFKEAYRLDQRPQFLWGVAQSLRLKGDCAAAIRAYEAFLRSGPTENGAKQALEQIDVCKRELASTPVREPTPSAPPTSQPVVAQPTARRPVAVEDTTERWTAGHIMLWGGAVIAVAGGATLLVGDHDMSGAIHQPTYASYLDTRDSARELQVFGVAGLGVGGVLAVIAITGFVIRDRGPERSVTIVPSPRGVAIAGHF